MANSVEAPPMSVTLKAARILITIQVAFGLVGAGLFLALFFSSFLWQYLPGLAYVAGSTALLGWLLSRWNSRRVYLRWSFVAMQVVPVGADVVDMILYSTVDWRSVVVGNSLGWAVVVLLLLPSAGRWFDKPRELR
ncbi:hypothetical protein SMD20_31195 [Nonomuraea sp. LP-02]|uniref:hypothetical protein n=1 Tax=Nonomuraea sp. LP-02 TaxID=3097960 RepID=UPI002E2EE6EA|nr:hypothetical protein [Nonomuraea sp. LP-02]MED7928752.1 hypothetical protein [Nonomuraea sp. LP-02]